MMKTEVRHCEHDDKGRKETGEGQNPLDHGMSIRPEAGGNQEPSDIVGIILVPTQLGLHREVVEAKVLLRLHAQRVQLP